MFNKFRGQHKEEKRLSTEEEFVFLEEETVEEHVTEEDPLSEKFVEFEQEPTDPVTVVNDERETQLRKEEDEWFRRFKGEFFEESSENKEEQMPDVADVDTVISESVEGSEPETQEPVMPEIEDLDIPDPERASAEEKEFLADLEDLIDQADTVSDDPSQLPDQIIPEIEELEELIPAETFEQEEEFLADLEELIDKEEPVEGMAEEIHELDIPEEEESDNDAFLDELDQTLDSLDEMADSADTEGESSSEIPDDEAEFMEDLLSDLTHDEDLNAEEKSEDDVWIQELITDIENNVAERPEENAISAQEEEELLRNELDAIDDLDVPAPVIPVPDNVSAKDSEAEEVIPASVEEIPEPIETSEDETEEIDESSWYESTTLLHTAAIIVLDLTEE